MTNLKIRLLSRGGLIALILLSLTAFPNTVQAQTLIYNNGSFSTSNTNALAITTSTFADDFVFGSSQSFDSARVWLMDIADDPALLESFSGTLSWEIYNNNAGKPGTVLLSGTVFPGGVSLNDTAGRVFGHHVFQADFSLGSQNLVAGTYWFRIKEGLLSSGGDSSEILWVDSGASTGFRTQENSNFTVVNPPTNLWRNSLPANRAFQFFSSGAPEPGTLALLALGMVVGIVARRRSREAPNGS